MGAGEWTHLAYGAVFQTDEWLDHPASIAGNYQAAVRPTPVIVMIASPASSLAARSTSAVIE